MKRQLHAGLVALALLVSLACTAASVAPPPIAPQDRPPTGPASTTAGPAVDQLTATPGATPLATTTAVGRQNAVTTSVTSSTSLSTGSPSNRTPRQVAEETLATMTLEQRVGQVFMLGFVGTSLTEANTALVRGLHLGGVALFSRNIENGPQLAGLDAALQSIADPVPLFVAVDQEGGLVVRVTDGATVFPGNMAIGATGDPTLARSIAEASARELLAMGINMDLAPVIDTNTNPLNPVIGIRSFGANPSLVSELGIETIQGLQANGVSAVGKHFPGHGDTDVDSHRDLPVVRHGLDRLQSLELVPFKAAIQSGVDGIMTAHLYLPAIEPQQDLPATLSRTVLTGLLREQLGYQGLILTDALDMDAIKKHRTAAEAAVVAFQAGADLLLIAGITADDKAHLADGPPALLEAVRSGRVSPDRLDESVLRILEAKARRGILAGAVDARPTGDLADLNSAPHRALALEAARRAVTLQRDTGHVLPLTPSQHVLVVVPDAPTRSAAQDDTLSSSLLEAIRRYAPGAVGAQAGGAVAAARGADVIVLGTFDLAQSPDQKALAEALTATGKPVVGISLRGPYDAAEAPAIGTFLAVYGDRPVHLTAAAEALFGELTPTGSVP